MAGRTNHPPDLTPSRTSARIAKRKHHGTKPGCACCPIESVLSSPSKKFKDDSKQSMVNVVKSSGGIDKKKDTSKPQKFHRQLKNDKSRRSDLKSVKNDHDLKSVKNDQCVDPSWDSETQTSRGETNAEKETNKILHKCRERCQTNCSSKLSSVAETSHNTPLNVIEDLKQSEELNKKVVENKNKRNFQKKKGGHDKKTVTSQTGESPKISQKQNKSEINKDILDMFVESMHQEERNFETSDMEVFQAVAGLLCPAVISRLSRTHSDWRRDVSTRCTHGVSLMPHGKDIVAVVHSVPGLTELEKFLKQISYTAENKPDMDKPLITDAGRGDATVEICEVIDPIQNVPETAISVVPDQTLPSNEQDINLETVSDGFIRSNSISSCKNANTSNETETQLQTIEAEIIRNKSIECLVVPSDGHDHNVLNINEKNDKDLEEYGNQQTSNKNNSLTENEIQQKMGELNEYPENKNPTDANIVQIHEIGGIDKTEMLVKEEPTGRKIPNSLSKSGNDNNADEATCISTTEAQNLLESLTKGATVAEESKLDELTGFDEQLHVVSETPDNAPKLSAKQEGTVASDECEPSLIINIKPIPMTRTCKLSADPTVALDELMSRLIVVKNSVVGSIKSIRPYKRSDKTNKKDGGTNQFPCDMCDYVGSEPGLISHKKRYHAPVRYQCEICYKDFGIKREGVKHRITHEKDRRKELMTAFAERQKRRDFEGEVMHVGLDKMAQNTKSAKSTMVKDPERATNNCKYCEYRGTKTGLYSHIKRYHPIRVHTCEICGKAFGTNHQLNSHKGTHLDKVDSKEEIALDLIHEPEEDSASVVEMPEEFLNIHKCDICGYSTTKSGLTQHKLRHHVEKNIECDICQKKFARKCDITSHRASHFDKDGNLRPRRTGGNEDRDNEKAPQTDENNVDSSTQDKYSKLHKCDICGFQASYYAVKGHKRRVHLEKKFQCNICMKKFHSKYPLKAHKTTHFTGDGELKSWIKEKLTNGEGYKCSVQDCSFLGHTHKALGVHLARVHGDKYKKHICEYCLFMARSKDEIDNHIARKHKPHDFKCNLCEKTYAFEKDLDRHMGVVHHDKELCHCELCGKEFKALRYLKMHMERHEGKFRSFCPFCNKGFMDKARMVEHCETHKPVDDRNTNFRCEICGKKFIRKAAMKQHMDSHMGTRSHKCNICDKAFTLPQTLCRHKKRHSHTKPYPCTYPGCIKAFIDKTSLDCHQVVHTGQSKHKCPTCNKPFTQASTLRRHVCKAAMQNMVLEANRNLLASTSNPAATSTSEASRSLVSLLNSSLINSNHQAIVIQPNNMEVLSAVHQLTGQTMQLPEKILGESEELMIVVPSTDQDSIEDSNIRSVIHDDNVQSVQEQIIFEPKVETEADANQNPEQEQEMFLCSICEQLFQSWDDVQLHMQIHMDNDTQATLAIVSEDSSIQHIEYQHEPPSEEQFIITTEDLGSDLQVNELAIKCENEAMVVEPVEHVVLMAEEVTEQIQEHVQFMCHEETEHEINVTDVDV